MRMRSLIVGIVVLLCLACGPSARASLQTALGPRHLDASGCWAFLKPPRSIRSFVPAGSRIELDTALAPGERRLIFHPVPADHWWEARTAAWGVDSTRRPLYVALQSGFGGATMHLAQVGDTLRGIAQVHTDVAPFYVGGGRVRLVRRPCPAHKPSATTGTG